MSISTMKKVTIVSLNKDAGRIMRKLMWLGCVEVEKTHIESSSELSSNKSDNIVSKYDNESRIAFQDMQSLDEAKKLLISTGLVKTGFFCMPPKISKSDFDKGIINGTSYDEIVKKANELLSLKKEQNALTNELENIDRTLLNLRMWSNLDLNLKDNKTEYTSIIYGTIPSTVDKQALYDKFEQENLSEVIEIVNETKSTLYIAAIYLNKEE